MLFFLFGSVLKDALRVRLQVVVIAYEMVYFHFLHTAKGLATKSIKMTLVSVGSL